MGVGWGHEGYIHVTESDRRKAQAMHQKWDCEWVQRQPMGVTNSFSYFILGNIVAAWVACTFGRVLDHFFETLGLPPHGLSAAQHKLPAVRMCALGGSIVGITIGMTLGMFPLFLLGDEKKETQ